MGVLTWGDAELYWGSSLLTWGPYTPAPVVPVTSDAPPAIDWMFSVGPGASAASPGPVRNLVEARGRVITWRARGHAWAQFTIDGRSDDAAWIVPKLSDLWAYRNSQLVFRGRVLTISPSLDPESHLWNVLAVDYRGMLSLAAAVEPPVPVFSGVDQGAIPWALIDAWQALDGGDWGITDGAGAVSGTLRDEKDITAGTPVGEVIDRLADRSGGFEWEITPDLVLNRYHPRRERDQGVVLDWGGMVLAVTGVDAPFANTVVATGDEGTVPAVATVDLDGDERGRWTTSQASPSVKNQEHLDEKAVFERDRMARAAATWTATLRPPSADHPSAGWGGQSQLWLGDLVRFEVAAGAISVSSQHRVVELQAVCGDHGTETIRVGLVPE